MTRPVDKVIPIDQVKDGLCEVFCLAMMYRAFGERVDPDILVGEIQPDLGMIDSIYFGGTLPEQSEESARRHGYQVFWDYNVPYDSLISLTRKGLPVMVSWMSDMDRSDSADYHSSVVTYADKEKIKYADPSYGEFRFMDRENFERKWCGFERNGQLTKHFALVIWKEGGT